MNRVHLQEIVLYGVGVLGSKAIYFILVPIYSFFLSPKDLGFYDLVLASITIIVPLSTIQISDGCYRFLLDSIKFDKKTIISTSFSVVVFVQLATLIFFLIGHLLFDLQKYFYVLIFQISFSFYIFLQQTIRGLKKTASYALLGLINFFLAPLLSLIFFQFYQNKINAVIFALILSQVTSMLIVLFPQRHFITKLNIGVDRNLLNKLFNYSLPLVPNSISWWLIDVGNRFLILLYLGQEMNGIYAVAARFAGIIAIFNSVLVLKWQDFVITKQDKNPNKKFSKTISLFFMAELIVILYILPLSDNLIHSITPSSYHFSSKILPILLLSALFSAITAFQGAIFLRKKHTTIILYSTLAGATVNILFSTMLISTYGLYAVSIGTLLGFVTTYIIRGIKGKIMVISRSMLLGVTLFIALYLLNYNYTTIKLLTSILITTILLVLNYKIYFKNELRK